MRILIVEDEVSINEAVSELLQREGYLVDSCYDGEDGYNYIMSNIYDLVILDLMLPNLGGYEILKLIRNKSNDVKVLVLSALGEVDNKVRALELGGDDYLTKPFSPKELLARIKAILRRPSEVKSTQVVYKDLSYDHNIKRITCGNKEINLSTTEANLFFELISRPKTTINKEQLFFKTWGFDSETDYSTIEVYVSYIRKKLREVESTVQIKTIRNEGYYLE